jgi:hypothetical protein
VQSNDQKWSKEIFRGILMAHVILGLQVLLVALLGLTVVFLGGAVRYMLWIFLGGAFLLILSAYILYRRAKARGKSALQDLAQSEIFSQGNVEVRFLGGLASLKINRRPEKDALPDSPAGQNLQLEDPETIRVRELTQLAQMLEKDLITADEYNRAKKHILKSI